MNLTCILFGHKPDKPGDLFRKCTRCPAVWCSCGQKWKTKQSRKPGHCNCRRPGYTGV